MKTSALILLLLCSAVLLPVKDSAAASCDQYPGDTWIYGGITSVIKPNVLIIIDTSGSMSDTVPGAAGDYDPASTYSTNNVCYAKSNSKNSSTCSASKIYMWNSSNSRWVDDGYNLSSVTTSCNKANPYNLLSTTGKYTGRSLNNSGNNKGSCLTSGTGTYATGNWINWDAGGTVSVAKIDVARNVVKNLIASTTGVNMGVMIYRSSDDQGSRFFVYKADGTNNYETTVKDMDAIYSGSMTNRDALIASINTNTVQANGNTPLAESLYEAGRYFGGGQSAFSNTVGLSGSPLKYTTPITASCQKNFIIFVTDGMSTSDSSSILKTIYPIGCSGSACTGDYDGDGVEPHDMSHSMDDVAKYLHDTDLLPDDTAVGKEYTVGKQFVSTYTIGFGTVGGDAAAVALLKRAADSSHGNGKDYLSADQSGLTTAFTQIIFAILSIDTSFVAPVVPISPDNRTYGSNRIYMGFFKPENQTYWRGNLKKYGLDANNNIIDKNGNAPFTSTSLSYWNLTTTPDANIVDQGGAGAVLLSRTTARNLYTYTGTNAALTDSSNLFIKTNAAISATTLNVADAATKDDLVDFIQGYDVYNKGSGTTIKREWLFGDLLHSKPLVVNYATYTMTTANESICSLNKSVIYVGSNDGMLHAINDCDGSEAWAFIPPEVLPNLQEIPGAIHTYAVDSSPSVYIYDANRNGNIETSTDKVILMIGLRRGGGPNNYSGVPAEGSYYALDVSDPAAPKYLWNLSNATTGFSELGESWGEPKIVKMKIGTVSKMVAFIPGGYDNMNEDSRYGATLNFTGTGTVSNSTSGAGSLISTPISPSIAQFKPKGRGIYAVEIATLASNGAPTITTVPTRIWSVVQGSTTSYSSSPATDAGMTFSIVSDITTLDVDGNGYVDRLYVTDLGGSLWRFDVGSTNTGSWTGYKIFSANPATGAETGRKFFFKPIATLETKVTTSSRGNDALIFIGSGDREHPTNTSVVDRIYAVRDKGQTSAKTEADPDPDLINVTTDALQAATATATEVNALLATLNSSYGWYIKLNQNSGEKVLAQPALSNKIVYFTTFTPGTSVNVDPCLPSNLGTSRLYVLNYATGEAVMNYDTSNDGTLSSTTNKRAKSGGTVLQSSDRAKVLGSGIASGVVIVGDKALIGVGGEVKPEVVKKGSSGSSGGRIINLYWGQK